MRQQIWRLQVIFLDFSLILKFVPTYRATWVNILTIKFFENSKFKYILEPYISQYFSIWILQNAQEAKKKIFSWKRFQIKMSLPQPVKKSCHFHDSMQRIQKNFPSILQNIFSTISNKTQLYSTFTFTCQQLKKSIYKLFQ